MRRLVVAYLRPQKYLVAALVGGGGGTYGAGAEDKSITFSRTGDRERPIFDIVLILWPSGG